MTPASFRINFLALVRLNFYRSVTRIIDSTLVTLMSDSDGEPRGLAEKSDKIKEKPGNTKVGSIIVPLTSCLTGLD